MWIYENGKKIFAHGQDDAENAVKAAQKCDYYKKDYDEECFEDEDLTCYNCRYRRWTNNSFQCMKGE